MNPLVLSLLLAAGEPCSLTVAVAGAASAEGTMMIALAATPEQFDPHQKGDPYRRAKMPVTAAGTLVHDFGPVECGTYAVRLFHDLDGDGRLGKNFLGIPTEPYGFSNDAQGSFGPPAFDAAAVAIDGPATLTVTLRQ